MENEELTCIVCYEIFNDPVSIPCGHTFCRDCIEETIRRSQKCPLCFCPFFNNINFKTNITLKKIIEKLKEKNIDEAKKNEKTEIKEEKIPEKKQKKTETPEKKEEKKEEEQKYEQLLGFQLSKISPFFKGTLYKIKIENHYNRTLFTELSKNNIFIAYYTKDDKTAVKFNLKLIESFSSKFITLIAICLGKIKIKSFQEISFKNNPYFLENNLLVKDEEFLLTKINYLNFDKISADFLEIFSEELKVIDKKAAFFYNKLKLYNDNEYRILGHRHKVFIVNGKFSLDYKINLDDYIDFLSSALNFSNKKKLVLFRSDDPELKIKMIYDFLKDLSREYNAVFIFFIRDNLENHNKVLVYILIMLIGFVFYKYFMENKNTRYYYN